MQITLTEAIGFFGIIILIATGIWMIGGRFGNIEGRLGALVVRVEKIEIKIEKIEEKLNEILVYIRRKK